MLSKFLTPEQQELLIDEPNESEFGDIMNYSRYVANGYNVEQIFGLLLGWHCRPLMRSDIQYFLDRGVMLNHAYPCFAGPYFCFAYDMATESGRSVVDVPLTPLNICYFSQHEDTARLLISMGADPNQADASGITPFEAIATKRLSSCADDEWIDSIISDLQEAYNIGVRPPQEFIVNKSYLAVLTDHSIWLRELLQH